MYAPEQSDRLVVPEKRSNEGMAACYADVREETVEGRSLTKGNS